MVTSAAAARVSAAAARVSAVAAREQAAAAKGMGVVAMAEAVAGGLEAMGACLVALVPTEEEGSSDPSPVEAAQSSTHGRSAPTLMTCRPAAP